MYRIIYQYPNRYYDNQLCIPTFCLYYYVCLKDWAAPGDVYNIGMLWHIPSAEEVQFASQIIQNVLGTELDAVQSISENNQMKRYVLCRRIQYN